MIRRLLTLSAICLSLGLSAQDLHFSQFFYSPLTLNPALTGNYVEDYRISGIHRHQWSGINSLFSTTAIGFDMNFKGGVLDHDVAGAGIFILRDELGENVVANTSVILSGSYHRVMDAHKRHHASIGLQAGFVQKRIDFSTLQFGNQYDPWIYNPALSSNETTTRESFGYADIRIGGIWDFKVTDSLHVNAGISFFGLTTPKETIYSIANYSNDLSTRTTVHLGADYRLNDKFAIMPRILLMGQSKAHDINIGSLVEYKISPEKDLTLIGGAWYRIKDAAIILGGARKGPYQIALSYDATTSGFRNIKNSTNVKSSAIVNSWEISFIYKGIINRPLPPSYQVPCGIF